MIFTKPYESITEKVRTTSVTEVYSGSSKIDTPKIDTFSIFGEGLYVMSVTVLRCSLQNNNAGAFINDKKTVTNIS